MVRIYRTNKIWFFIGSKYQGAHANLNVLIAEAKRAGE